MTWAAAQVIPDTDGNGNYVEGSSSGTPWWRAALYVLAALAVRPALVHCRSIVAQLCRTAIQPPAFWPRIVLDALTKLYNLII